MGAIRSKTAELHLHFGDVFVDYEPGSAPKVREHGIPVRQIRETANALINSGISFYANTQHHKITDASWDLQDMIEGQLALASMGGKKTRSITPLLGAEVSVRHQGVTFHVNVLYDQWFNRQNVPALPTPFSELQPTVEALRNEANCVLVLNHPFVKASNLWADERRRLRIEHMTHELIGSGLFHGVETLNGAGFMVAPDSPSAKYMTTRATQAVNHWRERGVTLSAIGGSDAHQTSHVAQALTRVEALNRREFCEALRHGEGSPMPRHVRVVNGFDEALENPRGWKVEDYDPKILKAKSFSTLKRAQ